MSSMAKIFVVVNLVLGIAAFGSAATLLGAQDDYKTAVMKASKKFDEYKEYADNKIDSLDNQVLQQSQKAATELARANQLQDERDEKNNRLTEAKGANETLRSTVDTLTQEVRKANEIIQKAQTMQESLSQASKKATEDSLKFQKELEDERTNRGSLEQQVSLLNDQVQELSAKLGTTEASLRDANWKLDRYAEIFGPLPGQVSKGKPGQVIDIRGNLVGISVGSADGVRIGDIYSLRRGASFVGTIKIIRVEKNMAVGEFDQQFPGNGAPPQMNDVAAPSNQ